MNLHLFYMVRNAEGKSLSSAFLYAFTTDDDLSKEFLLTRSKNVFYHKVRNIESKDEIAEFKKNVSDQRLIRTKLRTRKEKFSNETIEVPIVLTAMEELEIFRKSDMIIPEIAKKLPDLMFVKDEFLKPLYTIQYFQNYKFMTDTMSYFYSGCNSPYEFYPALSYKPDEYRLFMYLYGGLFDN